MKVLVKISSIRIIVLIGCFLASWASMDAQNSLTSVKINITNLRLSEDLKTVSYDVFLQDVDPDYPVAVPGFVFRLAVPIADVGANEKIAFLTNPSPELGSVAVTMTANGSNWMMKFLNGTLVISYGSALMLADTFPGSRIGTFNFRNADSSEFSNPLAMNLLYSGSGVTTKSTVTIFQPGTTYLAPNTSAAQPQTNFSGLGLFTLSVAESGKSSMTYQGLLTDRISGMPISGVRNIKATLYDSLTGGNTILPTQVFNATAVDNGVFSIVIKKLTPAVLAGDNAYLELIVNDTILEPRVRLLASPYSITCKSIDGVTATIEEINMLSGRTFSSDIFLSGDNASNTAIPTQKAVKTYVDNTVLSKMDRVLAANTTVLQGANSLTFSSNGEGKTIINGKFQTNGAVYGSVRTHSLATNIEWQEDDYIVVVTNNGISGVVALPDPAQHPGRILGIRNNTGGAIAPAVGGPGIYWPENFSNLAGGAAAMFISDGTAWINMSR